jgi:hypothetical protein
MLLHTQGEDRNTYLMRTLFLQHPLILPAWTLSRFRVSGRSPYGRQNDNV